MREIRWLLGHTKNTRFLKFCIHLSIGVELEERSSSVVEKPVASMVLKKQLSWALWKQESIDFYKEHGYVRLKDVFNAATLDYYGNAITRYVEASEHVRLHSCARGPRA